MIDFVPISRGAHDEVEVRTSDEQHVADLVRFCKGWHKFAPFVGACLLETLNDEIGTAELQARIASEIQEDGATLRRVALEADGSIKIDATYA